MASLVTYKVPRGRGVHDTSSRQHSTQCRHRSQQRTVVVESRRVYPMTIVCAQTDDHEGDQRKSILGMTRAMTSKGASLSMKQRWRALGLYIKALREYLVEHVAVIKAMVALYQEHVAKPYGVLADGYNRIKDSVIEDYEQYLAEETKSRWCWEKRNRKELAFLHSIPPYIGMACTTVLYQAFVPLSISAAIIGPLYLSWVLYDRWWASPIVLGMILYVKSSMVIVAILLTVVASTACSIGKALQKEATSHLPKFSLDNEKVIQQYRQSEKWLVGVALDVGGGILQTVAFAMAPVSLLQPISGIGLVGLALYSHFYLKENLRMDEWAAVGVATLGTLGLGSTSGGVDHDEKQPGAMRMIFTLLLVGYGVANMNGVRERYMKGQKGLSKVSAALYGLQAGGCFGLSASTIRTGFLMASSRRWTWAPFGIICGVGLSSYGFVLQTCGLKEGSAVIVCTCVAVVAMVVGVVVGIVGLGEAMPSSHGSIVIRVCSWGCIMYGVVVLSGGIKVVRDMVAAGIELIPAQYWHHIPDGIAVKIKSWVNAVHHDQGLPEKHSAATRD